MRSTLQAVLAAATLILSACGGGVTTCHTTDQCLGSEICNGEGLCVECTALGSSCQSSNECCGTTTCDPGSFGNEVCTQF